MNIHGFVGKPDTAKKTTRRSYFFVNNRFIKSGYLNHAVMNAFSEMIPADSFSASMLLFIDLDPAHVDINVHPTKQEIKFDDEKHPVRLRTVRHQACPGTIQCYARAGFRPGSRHPAAGRTLYAAFHRTKETQSANTSIYKTFTHANQAHVIDNSSSSNLQHWKELYGAPAPPDNDNVPQEQPASTASVIDERWQEAATDHKVPVQVHQQYILSQIKSGFILIDQRAAHERILYERYQKALAEKPMATQQSLFPQTIGTDSCGCAGGRRNAA